MVQTEANISLKMYLSRSFNSVAKRSQYLPLIGVRRLAIGELSVETICDLIFTNRKRHTLDNSNTNF